VPTFTHAEQADDPPSRPGRGHARHPGHCRGCQHLGGAERQAQHSECAVDNVLVGLLVDTVIALTYPRWLRSCTRTARDRRIGVSVRE
jgi:hypothetical protein